MTKFTFTDEAGAIAHVEMLENEIETLSERLSQRPAATEELTAARASITTLTAERDALRAENETLKANSGDINKRVACEVAKLGIRPHAVSLASFGAQGGPSATERVLAAKGVSSLEQLESKNP